MTMKREFILYIAMSLDGYIARKDGSIDWLSGHEEVEEDIGYEEFLSNIDTVIMGRTTYEQIIHELSVDVWPYENQKSYVITSKSHPTNEHVTFVQDIEELIYKLQKETGKGIWIVGGSKIVSYFMKHQLIDQFQIAIMPTILGEGIPLFSYKGGEGCPLRLVKSKVVNGITLQTYRRR